VGPSLRRCFVLLGLATLSPTAKAQEISQPTVRSAVARVAPAGLLAAAAPLTKMWQPGDPTRLRSDLKRRAERGQLPVRALQAIGPDPLLRGQSIAGAGAQPAIVVDFAGIPSTGFAPPDIIGAVGPSHYIQMIRPRGQI
jgi:hypothetical protein